MSDAAISSSPQVSMMFPSCRDQISTSVQEETPLSKRERALRMEERRALIIRLNALEDYLDIARSIMPRRARADCTER